MLLYNVEADENDDDVEKKKTMTTTMMMMRIESFLIMLNFANSSYVIHQLN